MNKFVLKACLALGLLTTNLLITPMASAGNPATAAQEMSCIVSVYRAKDFKENADQSKVHQKVVLPIVDGSADQEFQVNGETVAVTLFKKEYTDLYSMTVVLTTPVADRPVRGPKWVALLSDYVYNDGPTKNNGWDLDPGPTAVRYAYLQRGSGAFGFSTKLVAALKTAGKWGTHPFAEYSIDSTGSMAVAEFVEAQLNAGKLKDEDVMGVSTVLSCTLDNVGAKKFPR